MAEVISDAMHGQQILYRRKKVAELYLNNIPQYMIAEELGCSVGTVNKDLQWLRQQWLAKMGREFAERKSEELAKIDRMETEAWNAWEKSKQNKEKVYNSQERGRTGKRGNPLPPLIKVTKTVEGQSGDPRHLQTIAWCIETRLKLMGALKKEGDEDRVLVIDWQSLFDGRALHQANGNGSQPKLEDYNKLPSGEQQGLVEVEPVDRTRVIDPIEEMLQEEERKVRENGSTQDQGD